MAPTQFLGTCSQGHANQSFLSQCLRLQFRSSSTKDQQNVKQYKSVFSRYAHLKPKNKRKEQLVRFANWQLPMNGLKPFCRVPPSCSFPFYLTLLFTSQEWATHEGAFEKPNIIGEDPMKMFELPEFQIGNLINSFLGSPTRKSSFKKLFNIN